MIKRLFILSLCLLGTVLSTESHAFWIWTPESGEWVNPKYAVKESPQKQLEYALEFYKAEEYPEALRELRKLIKHYERAREAAEAQYYIAQVFEKQGQLFKAFQAYQEVIDKYPFTERFKEIIGREFELGNRIMEGTQYEKGLVKKILGSEFDVVEIFRTVIRNDPYGEYAPEAQYKIGLYLQEKGVYDEARDAFEKVVNDYPDSKWVRPSEYQIAIVDAQRSPEAEYDQKVTQTAVRAFKEFVEKNPDAELSRQAREQIKNLREKEAENNFLIAKFYEKREEYRAAKIYYDTVATQYTDTSWASKALEKIRDLSEKIEE